MRILIVPFQTVLYILLIMVLTTMMPLSAFAQTDKATEMGFVAHKALYEVRMASKKSSANVSNITGTMIYQWQPSCDGAWMTSHNFDMLYEYREMTPMRVDSNFSTRETFDGLNFNFALQRKRNSAIFEEVRGSANKKDKNGGLAEYTIPADLSYKISPQTLFPTSHTMAVIEQIRKKQKFGNLSLFDGSDDKGPMDVNTFILSEGEVPEGLKGVENINQALLKAKSWKLRLAFFPLIDAADSQADYELSVNFHENGIISDMKIDYDDFSVTQKLRALEPIKISCEK